MEYLLLEKRKNYISNITLKFWIYNLEPLGIKERIKKLNHKVLMNHQTEAQSVNSWEKVKTHVALLPWWPRRRIQKVQNPYSGYTNRK